MHYIFKNGYTYYPRSIMCRVVSGFGFSLVALRLQMPADLRHTGMHKVPKFPDMKSDSRENT